MFFLLRGFILLFLLYHLLVTIFWFGIFQWNFPQIPALIRDSLWIVLLIWSFFYYISYFAWYWKRWKNLLYIFFLLLWTSIFFSYVQNKEIYDMFIWFKYWFHYLFLFLSATFVGHILSRYRNKKQNTEKHYKIKRFIDFFVRTLISIVTFWYIWQLAKIAFPELFFGLWYWPLNDFQFWTNPPIYYLTWFGGTMRWQWIFAWPNNYWYFLVAFLPLILSYFKFSISSWKNIFTKKLNLTSLFVYLLWFGAIAATLSRSAILGTIIVLFLMNIKRWKRNWKIGIGIWIILIIWLIGLSILKESSTLAHISAKFYSIKYVLANPLWYWLWSSWPAIHHNWNILPENYFIQLLIDIWIIWFSIIALRYIMLWNKIKKLFFVENLWSYIRALSIWRAALLLIWIFLHVFEDSMVNYSFFVVFGILNWYAINFKNKSKK